jgi:hypothetical protein
MGKELNSPLEKEGRGFTADLKPMRTQRIYN